MRAHALCAHPLVETSGVGVGLNFQSRKAQLVGSFAGVKEKSATDTASHSRWEDKKILEVNGRGVLTQGGVAEDLVFTAGDVGVVVGDEARADGENRAPLVHPASGIAPMTFGGDSDFREDRSVGRNGSGDLKRLTCVHGVRVNGRRSPRGVDHRYSAGHQWRSL